jgi:hypothetical protein
MAHGRNRRWALQKVEGMVREKSRIGPPPSGLGILGALALALVFAACRPGPEPGSTWPRKYSVRLDRAGGVLTLSTPYYTVEHDLKKGGAISRIALRHGRAANLLVRPAATRVVGEDGAALADLRDAAPEVRRRSSGLSEVVTVESALADPQGRASGPAG